VAARAINTLVAIARLKARPPRGVAKRIAAVEACLEEQRAVSRVTLERRLERVAAKVPRAPDSEPVSAEVDQWSLDVFGVRLGEIDYDALDRVMAVYNVVIGTPLAHVELLRAAAGLWATPTPIALPAGDGIRRIPTTPPPASSGSGSPGSSSAASNRSDARSSARRRLRGASASKSSPR
jgi:hypothetical protein